MNRKELGNHGEAFVVAHLKQNGFTICSQNYRKFFGEIDIIAMKNNLYVFVEVKTRKSNLISLHHLIQPSKQKKIIKVAESFIAEKQLYDVICRFDVALLQPNEKDFRLEYIENAFIKKEENGYGI